MNENKSETQHADLELRVASHPFVHDLSDHHVQLLADCAVAIQFKADEVIFRKGEPANRFYLIEKGSVAVEGRMQNGAPVRIDTVSEGGLLGWSWLFEPYAWEFDARAIEPTTAIFFYGTLLREHCNRDQTLGHELFRRMSKVMVRRLQAARARLIAEKELKTQVE